MADEKEKGREKKDLKEATAVAPAADAPVQQQAQTAVTMKIDGAKVSYVNMARATGTPEEVILDLGLNPNPFNPTPSEDILVDHRIVLSYPTTKRLLMVLSEIIRRHEGAFGVIETDVRRRIRQ